MIYLVGSVTAFVNGNARAVLAGAIAVPTTALLAVAAPDPGPASWHMATHIAAMNVTAPIAAVILADWQAERTQVFARPRALWTTTIIQLTVLWAAHSSTVHHNMQASAMSAVAVHALLFLAALAFWLSVAAAPSHRWQAMLALLISGKSACLLGVLFIFAPRPLLVLGAARSSHLDQGALLADQHLAGLLMIAACPLSYVLTAVVLAAQTLDGRKQACCAPGSEATVGR